MKGDEKILGKKCDLIVVDDPLLDPAYDAGEVIDCDFDPDGKPDLPEWSVRGGRTTGDVLAAFARIFPGVELKGEIGDFLGKMDLNEYPPLALEVEACEAASGVFVRLLDTEDVRAIQLGYSDLDESSPEAGIEARVKAIRLLRNLARGLGCTLEEPEDAPPIPESPLIGEAQLRKIEALKEKATGGKWYRGTGRYGGLVSTAPIGSRLPGADDVEAYGGHLVGESMIKANVVFIAEVVNLLPQLTAEIRRLRALLKQ